MLASTELEELEATDPKFDDVKVLARSEQGELIAIPIKVSIMHIFKLYPRPDNNLSGNWLLDRI